MKYKELRVLAVVLLIFIGANIRLVMAISSHDKRMIIASILVIFSALWITIGRFNHKIGEDYIFIYEYKLIGILPTMIDFKDIQSIDATKHTVTIEHQKKSKIYMLNGIAFQKELMEKLQK